MKNIAIINTLNLSKYTFEKIFKGKSAFEKVSEYASLLPDTEEILFINLPEEVAGKRILIDRKTVFDLLTILKEKSRGFDNIFYFYADTPFLDSEVTKKMYENHLKYFAEYTFADGYPYGIAPEILKSSALEHMLQLVSDSDLQITRTSVFDVIKRDINSFDIETVLSPVDLRLLRVTLSADERRNFLLLKRINDLNGEDASSVIEVLQNHREILRTLPAYISIQLVTQCPYNCEYCPYPSLYGMKGSKNNSEMNIENFKKIIEMVEKYSEDAYINISLWGEPAFHSRIGEIIQYVLGKEKLQLVIETTGIGWQLSLFDTIKSSALRKKPIWIVSLDAFSEETYRRLRGEGFAEAVSTAEKLIEYFPQNTHIQAVRMKENEEELEDFYRYWKKKTNNVIIQKYDYFCKKLPDRRVTDLSPLKRFPCWHLQRDLYVLIDGTVPLCREDLEGSVILGNILDEGIERVWEEGQKYYLSHVKENYPEICKNCDEYYTYNF